MNRQRDPTDTTVLLLVRSHNFPYDVVAVMMMMIAQNSYVDDYFALGMNLVDLVNDRMDVPTDHKTEDDDDSLVDHPVVWYGHEMTRKKKVMW